jgi:MFS family permease
VLLRHRDFRLLWGGETVSELGSQVSLLAIPLLAVRTLHATTFEMGLLTTASTAAFLVVGLPAGVWVDRMRRRSVMIVADLGRVLALGSVPVAYALGGLTLAQLFVVTLSSGILTVLFDVAYQSYLPRWSGGSTWSRATPSSPAAPRWPQWRARASPAASSRPSAARPRWLPTR